MTKKHAKLSASGSAKWLNCPGSIKAEEKYQRSSSVYADEGTIAHELADRCLSKKQDASIFIGKTLKQLKIESESFPSDYIIEKDMCDYVQEYVDYVLSHETKKTMLFTEERVDFSIIVPEGFGTLDAAILDPETKVCHIFDLKYGKGEKVDAFENTQGQLYAVGVYNDLNWLGEIESFRIHIVQPRIPNFSYWDISLNDLKTFMKFAAERAELALTNNAPRVPGEKQCRWCLAKADCKALFKFTEEILCKEFDDESELDEQTLNKEQKKLILDNKDLIYDFLNAVEGSVFETLSQGEQFPGYKLVEGRSNRKFTDNAEKILVEKLGEEAYKKELIGIGEAEKKLGKKEMENITFKPEGKPTLAPEYDKRKAIVIKPISEEFEDETKKEL